MLARLTCSTSARQDSYMLTRAHKGNNVKRPKFDPFFGTAKASTLPFIGALEVACYVVKAFQGIVHAFRALSFLKHRCSELELENLYEHYLSGHFLLLLSVRFCSCPDIKHLSDEP